MSWLASKLTRNLGTKIVALLLAFVVYAHVYTEQEQQLRLRVPLHVRGLSAGLVLAGDPPPEVEITTRGKGKHLLKMRVRPPHVELDLSGARPGQLQRMLSPADVTLPVGSEATVDEVRSPRMVSLEVDTLVTKSVPVEVPLLGDLPDDYVWMGQLRPVPDRVSVIGPSRAVESLSRVITEPVNLTALDLSKANGPAQETRLLDLPDTRFRAVPAEVRITIPIAPLLERHLPAVAVDLVGVGPDLWGQVVPDSARVRVLGPAGVIDSLGPTHLALAVDAAGLGPGFHRLEPSINLSIDLVEVTGIEPGRFEVEIGPAPR